MFPAGSTTKLLGAPTPGTVNSIAGKGGRQTFSEWLAPSLMYRLPPASTPSALESFKPEDTTVETRDPEYCLTVDCFPLLAVVVKNTLPAASTATPFVNPPESLNRVLTVAPGATCLSTAVGLSQAAVAV